MICRQSSAQYVTSNDGWPAYTNAWTTPVIIVRKHIDCTINAIHLVLIELHHLLVVNKVVWAASVQVLWLWVMISYLWEHTTLSHLLIAVPDTRLLVIGASLSRNRLIFTYVFFQVILSFLSCKLNLVFLVKVSFIDISNVLNPFELIVFLPTLNWVPPKVPVDDMLLLLPEIHWLNAFSLADG